MKNSRINILGIKYVELGKFNVGEGGVSKGHYNPIFQKTIPHASGAQVKRNIVDDVLYNMSEPHSNCEIVYKMDGKEDIAKMDPNPNNLETLLRGVMRTDLGLTQESPFSIGALVPLHPLLSNFFKNKGAFDRRKTENSKITIKIPSNSSNEDDSFLDATSQEAIDKIDNSILSKLKAQKYLDEEKLVTGIFKYNIEIDLENLFSYSILSYRKEINNEIEEELLASGWIYNSKKTKIVLPKNRRDEIIPAIAESIIHWKINSNQSRNYSPLDTFAIAISHKAYEVGEAITAELEGDYGDLSARVSLDNSKQNLFTSKKVNSLVPDFHSSDYNLEKAKEFLIKLMCDYDYEK